MASLRELEEQLPAHFTLSNKNLILIAHVRDETVYFYDSLGPLTTVVLLAQPNNFELKRIFLDLMNDIGTTVIDLREYETFDPSYRMSDRSKTIITKLISEYKFEKIITHPKYDYENDPQNRELFDLVKKLNPKNHMTYQRIGSNGQPHFPCGIKKNILELYSSDQSGYSHPYSELIGGGNYVFNKKIYHNLVNITSQIHGLQPIN